MIVVDTNIILHFWIPGEYQTYAHQLIQKERKWVTVPLWRSEMRNVLKVSFRSNLISREIAYSIALHAEEHMAEREIPVTSKEVLDITLNGKCSGYDAEFVALAHKLQVPLVTCDKKLAREFPSRVFELRDYLKRAERVQSRPR